MRDQRAGKQEGLGDAGADLQPWHHACFISLPQSVSSRMNITLQAYRHEEVTD